MGCRSCGKKIYYFHCTSCGSVKAIRGTYTELVKRAEKEECFHCRQMSVVVKTTPKK